MDYTKKDKIVELVLAHRSIRDGLREDLKQCEALFNSDNHLIFERMMNSIQFADDRITSFLKRSGEANRLDYLQRKD